MRSANQMTIGNLELETITDSKLGSLRINIYQWRTSTIYQHTTMFICAKNGETLETSVERALETRVKLIEDSNKVDDVRETKFINKLLSTKASRWLINTKIRLMGVEIA